MKTFQTTWTAAKGWQPALPSQSQAQLVFFFGGQAILSDGGAVAEVRAAFPGANVLGCSTAGEIIDTTVSDDTLVVTAVEFSRGRVALATIAPGDFKSSEEAGEQLARTLEKDELVHVFVLSEGLGVNGTELVRGLTRVLPEGISVTGGLSGDGAQFKKTMVLSGLPSGAGPLEEAAVVAVGFYGAAIKVGFGSLGGWDTFGPERVITRSKANVLYELDGRSALELYKQYLGEHSKGLPATGLLFPLSIRSQTADTGVVRTILGVDEAEQSMTFAGDMPEGAYARLMMANFDRLIDGAVGAARTGIEALGSKEPELAILISCVGRKMVLQQRVEEEVEGVREILGDSTAMTGFYSYGEISPFGPSARCELHNQTMTITTFREEL